MSTDNPDTADTERWARIRMVTHAIPPTVNLDDPTAVSRALLGARLRCSDFADLLDEAIRRARGRP